nr:transglycosylase [Mycolicibacterium xanthum]
MDAPLPADGALPPEPIEPRAAPLPAPAPEALPPVPMPGDAPLPPLPPAPLPGDAAQAAASSDPLAAPGPDGLPPAPGQMAAPLPADGALPPEPIEPLAAPLPAPAPEALPPAPMPGDAPLPPLPPAPLPGEAAQAAASIDPLAAPGPEGLPPAPLPADGALPPEPIDPLAAPLPAPAVVEVANVAPAAPVDVPPIDNTIVATVANWDTVQGPAPVEGPQLWALHADVPLQPAPGDPALPPLPAPAPAAPAPNVVAAPDPLAPLANAPVPAPAYDIANQAVSGEIPLPAEVPHLVSPENLPPGTTVDPSLLPNQSANVTYLKEIWHAIQTQEISGKGALLALTQRPMTTPDPGGVAPAMPIDPAVPVDPAALPPVGVPGPVLPPA